MTLVKPRPLGFNDGTRLWDYELDSFQDQLVQALDGVGGGSYALTSDLVLQGGTAGKTLKWGEDGSSTQLYPSVASTITVSVPIPLVPAHVSNFVYPDFKGKTTGFLEQTYYDTGSNDPTVTIFMPQMIRGATLTAVHIGIDPLATPTRKTILDVRKLSSSGVSSSLGTIQDSTVAGYTDFHLLSVTGLAETISATAGHQYYLLITGEGGAGGSAGMVISAAYAHFDFTQIRP